MANFKRPGVYVEEQLLANNAIGASSNSFAAFVAPSTRGPETAVLVNSWTEYVNKFGNFTATSGELPYALFTYFSNGGRAAYVARVAGSTAVAATRTLNDRAGIPVATLRVDAVNRGAWGNNINISVSDSGTDRFNIVVKFGGTADANIVERWTNLSMDPTSDRYVVSIINDLANTGSGSQYVAVANLNSATAAPSNRPAVQSDVALATGADGGVPTSSEIITGVQTLNLVQEPLGLNLPGVAAATVAQAVTWAETRGDVFVVADPGKGRTPAQAVSDAAALPASSYVATYYPNVYISDPAVSTPGALKLVAPGGAVLGQYAATDAARGIHKAPAGLSNRVVGAVALERNLTSAELDSLNVSNVNAVRNLPGAGICIFGARTLELNKSSKYVPVRRTLIHIKSALLKGTRFAIFEPNDEVLWASLESSVSQFLYGLWRQGSLRGAAPTEAFYVKCDGETNPPLVVQAGEVRVEVGVSLQYPAEFVVIKVGQFEAGSSASEG